MKQYNKNQFRFSKLTLIKKLGFRFKKLIYGLGRTWCHHHGSGNHTWAECSPNPQSANYNPQNSQKVANDRGGHGSRGSGRGRRPF